MPPKVVIQKKAPTESCSKQNTAPTPAGTNGSSPSSTSLFGGKASSSVAEASNSLKRKANDPDLKVVDIDSKPDLTLIVGTPSHTKGQKAFRVSRSSFRNVSAVWTAMMSGDWAESERSEVSFPDDSCEAFQIVLQIAHFQMKQIPEILSREELVDVALLADKYQLEDAVRIGMDFKQWLKPHHEAGTGWKVDRHLQDFALIASAFQLQSNYEYLVNRLAMDVEVDILGGLFYKDENQGKVLLRPDLPPRVWGEVCRIRSSVLSAWTAICTVGLADIAKPPEKPTLCKKPLCIASRAGVLLMGLQTAGLFPSPLSTDTMRRSVVMYWKDIQNIGASYKNHVPCDKEPSYSSHRSYNTKHTSSCSFEKCFGDFGVINDARTILERHAHKDV